MDSILSIPYQTIAKFLKAAGGRYQNSIYIICKNCNYVREEGCGKFLFIYNEIPLLFPISDAIKFFGHVIEPEECVTSMDQKQFMKLYRNILLKIDFQNKQMCFFHQILNDTNWMNA